jgi:hypothetical protein
VRRPAIYAVMFGSALCAYTAQEPLAADRPQPRPASSVPTCVGAPAHPLKSDIGPNLVAFDASPFPYRGAKPSDGRPFIDAMENGRYGHTAPRAGVRWEDETYNSRNSLIYMPKGFVPSRRALIVVFFHGNNTELLRDVYGRQQVPQQLAASGLNAVLVAPQFALDAADSSAGHFWEPGFFKKYLAEAARHLAELYGDPCTKSAFAAMKIVLVAYSGGYNPAAYALKAGGANARLHGLALFDALYGETEKFDAWIDQRGPAFFFSAYSDSSQAENLALQRLLKGRHERVRVIKPLDRLRLPRGSISFLAAGPDTQHNDFMTQAWVANPLAAMLAGIEGPRVLQPQAQKH